MLKKIKMSQKELLAFLEGVLDPNDIPELEDISEDDLRIELKKLKGYYKQPISPKILKALRKKKAKLLKKKLLSLFPKGSKKVQNILKFFEQTFRYPCPSFVYFGTSEAQLLRPFGKVRYPIVFEWESVSSAQKYRISIEDKEWSLISKETKVEIFSKDIQLKPRKEYLWKRDVIKGKEVIKTQSRYGAFSLIDSKELEAIKEDEAKIAKDDPDRYFLLGSILEEARLYVEAIERYKDSYNQSPAPTTAYRIASCYDKLGLEGPRDLWNKKIPEET